MEADTNDMHVCVREMCRLIFAGVQYYVFSVSMFMQVQ